MADAMEIEDSDGSDTVEYDLHQEVPQQPRLEGNPISPTPQQSTALLQDPSSEQFGNAQLPEIVPSIAVSNTSVTVQKEQSSTSSTSREESKSGYEDDEDGTTCSICLDMWTTSGDHRICSLKCGHLFGYSCIQRWLDSQQTNKRCPTCKKKVRKPDFRFIYAKKLVAVDNVELETVKTQLQEALAEKNRISQDVARYISREHVLLQEISELRKKIQDLSIGSKPSDLRLSHKNPSMIRARLYMDKSIEICTLNDCRECRVFDVNVSHNLLTVASRSPTGGVFGINFGIRQIDLQNYKNIKFVHLHKSAIRDMSYHESEPWIMTASTDKSFKIVDPYVNGRAIHTVDVGSPLWSCCWDPCNNQQVLLGTQNGKVLVYDLRNTASALTALSVEGDLSPVVSIAGVKGGPYSDVPQGAVIVCKLNSLWAFENQRDGRYQRHSLHLDGPFLTLRYENKSKQLLVSARPNNQMNFMRHNLCSLEKIMDPETIRCHTVHTFRSGAMAKYLVRGSCFVPPDYVAGLHEAKKSVILYSVNTGDEVTSIPAHSTILDLKGFETSNGTFLGALTEKKIEFFKFSSTTNYL